MSTTTSKVSRSPIPSGCEQLLDPTTLINNDFDNNFHHCSKLYQGSERRIPKTQLRFLQVAEYEWETVVKTGMKTLSVTFGARVSKQFKIVDDKNSHRHPNQS